jgi:hypothetical protein
MKIYTSVFMFIDLINIFARMISFSQNQKDLVNGNLNSMIMVHSVCIKMNAL